jgi:hypothetical protein
MTVSSNAHSLPRSGTAAAISARAGADVLTELHRLVAPMTDHFDVVHRQGCLSIVPTAPDGLAMTVRTAAGGLAIAFNEVEVDAADAEEALRLLRLGLHGRLQVSSARRAGRLVSATLEMWTADGTWRPLAGCRQGWLRWGLATYARARNRPLLPAEAGEAQSIRSC